MDIVNNIKNTYESLCDILQNVVNGPKLSCDDLAELSYENVLDIVSWYNRVAPECYSERVKACKNFIDTWLNNDKTPLKEKIDALLIDNKDNNSIYLNDHKQMILGALSETNMHAFVKHVVNGNIKMTYKDLQQIDVMFARILSQQALPYISKRQLDDDEPHRYLMMNKWESLVVSCLKVFHDQLSESDVVDLMHCYVMVSDPMLFHMPRQYQCFEGDLLPWIWQHYDDNKYLIPPVVKYRRNIGVTVNIYNICTYESFASRKKTLANGISFIMPYMCYAYVSRVEVECIPSSYEPLPKLKMDNDGTDYIMQEPGDLKQEETSVDSNRKVVTLCATSDVKGPASYITIQFDAVTEMRYVHIKSVKLFGSAVTFV